MAETSLAASGHQTVSAYLTKLLENGSITEDDYNTIEGMHERELQSAKVTAGLTIPGNITISSTPTASYATLAAISRVFNTAELLEKILVNLDYELLTSVPLVCRVFNAMTNTSLPLQRRVFKAPDFTRPKLKYALLISELLPCEVIDKMGFTVDYHFPTGHGELQDTTIRVVFDCRKIDIRTHGLYLTQPPLKRLTPFFGGTHRGDGLIHRMDASLPDIYVEGGITVRDLIEWMKKLKKTKISLAGRKWTRGFIDGQFLG